MITIKWDRLLKTEYQKPYFKDLVNKVRYEYQTKTCYPEAENVFKAMQLTDYNNIKIVILGQDPYHGEHEAEGLSFSVKNEVKRPPSLLNIFKELQNDIGIPIPKTNSLEKWAKEGILLLNSILTVEKDRPASHKDMGWQNFTDEIIRIINKKDEPVVFILWGNYARSKKKLITNSKHLIIESTHPSPFSADKGFFGSKPFSKANKFLIENKISPVDFSLD